MSACIFAKSSIFFALTSINKYLQFIMGELAQAKNGDEQFWK
jgi:hypothetical protein